MKIVCIRNTEGYNIFQRKKISFKEGNVYWYTPNCRHLINNNFHFALYNTISYENGLEGYLYEEYINNFIIESEYRKEIKDLDKIFNDLLDGDNMQA